MTDLVVTLQGLMPTAPVLLGRMDKQNRNERKKSQSDVFKLESVGRRTVAEINMTVVFVIAVMTYIYVVHIQYPHYVR